MQLLHLLLLKNIFYITRQKVAYLQTSHDQLFAKAMKDRQQLENSEFEVDKYLCSHQALKIV